LIVGTKFVKFLRLAPMMAGPWGIALTALAIAAVAIIQNWDKIKPFFSKLFNWLKGTFNSVADKVKSAAKSGFLGPAAWIIANWGKVKTFFRDLPGKIGSFLSGIGSTLISPFKSAFNTVRDIFNRMIRFIRGAIGKIKGAVSDVGGFIGDGLGALGNVVGLADGGVVGPGAGGPQLFLAGEGGAKEYVISTEGPRNKNVGYLKEAASALGIPMFAQGGKVQDRINQRISNLQTKMDLKRRDFELTGGRVTSKEYDRLIGINQMIESSIKDLISVTKGQARRDARFALKSAQLDRRDLVKARNTATGEGSTATGDLDFQIQGLETQLQLAEGGYGGDAGALRTKIKSKLQKKLKTLRDRLSGTSNREQIMMLNDAIQGTLGQLSSYSSGESGASMIEQTAAASQLRYSALAQFGGNAFQSRLGSSIASSGQTVVNLNGEFKLDSNDPHGSVRELGYQIATNLN
jgi:Flp pilus assembly pilin Flp